MNETLLQQVGTVVGMFVTGGFGYLAARIPKKKDDRQLLSEDERQFRTELKEMMLAYQDKVVDLTDKVELLTESNIELKKSNVALEGRVTQLTVRNASLEKQVHTLTEVNEELRAELQFRRRRK